MGKFRSKLKGQTKGKRWAKGQSSSSNPETKTYRNQAKSRFFQENLGSSGLTTDKLRKHDAIQTESIISKGVSNMDMEDTPSVASSQSYQTIQSFASEWTDCSNMSFNKFLKVFRSDSALHKEMLAILAAVTEVIKQNGGTESPTEYFCSLITTLEQIMSADQINEDQITAILSLINMGIKTVPKAVLKNSYNTIADKLLMLLNQYCNSENNIIIKSIFGILAEVLKSQEYAIWSNLNVQNFFCAILNPFCLHRKPKWRKAARLAASSVVRADYFQTENCVNHAANKVAEFCEKSLEACMGNNSSTTVLVASIKAGQTTILHTLGLMKDTISSYSKTHIKACSELILRLMSLNYPIVTSCGLQVLHSLFSTQKAVVSGKLNCQIIAALYEYQPSILDVQPTQAWLAVMQQAHVHLADIDLSLSCTALPKIFTIITQLWLSQKPEVVMAATQALQILVQDGIGPACATPALILQHSSKISSCFQSIELGLGYQYNHAWHQVLHVISVMFEVGGANCSEMLVGCLKTLSELRESYRFSYNNELEHAVGAAVRSMGPETVLNVISLKKENGELNLDRSWILPVLKENIQRSNLDYWMRGILPLAMYCQKRSVELAASNDGIGAHSSELLHLQLWNLLPSFCNNPTDIKIGFKSIAKVLGVAISDRKELRLAVMASLRKLIVSARESGNEEDIAEISRFDKNYLPILFNVYTTKPIGSDEEGQRLAALDTVKVYLKSSKPELHKQLFDHALERLTKITDPEELFVKESILDLIRALVPYQAAEDIDILYKSCIKNLPEITNAKEQKKAYRLLEEICGSQSEGCIGFLTINRKPVQKLLVKSLSTAAVTSKGARLRCMNYLIKAQPQLDHESMLIRSVIPEAILSCKDINDRCRVAAYQLLNTIGETLQNHNQIDAFVVMLVAGLAGTPQLMSATIFALASILHNFTGALGHDNIAVILQNVLHLIRVPTREIVISCLSFVKVFSTCMPSPTVASNLPLIITSLSGMTDDCKRHFRLKVRNLLDRLVRKYGGESIIPYVPSTDTIMYKQLRNLRKLNARLKRRKDASDKEQADKDENIIDEDFLVKPRPRSVEDILADSDTDDDETDQKVTHNNKKYSAWIEEDADTIIDFKDPLVTSKITATKPVRISGTNPATDAVKAKDRGFKTAVDGRLIIEDGSSDSDSGFNKNQNKFDNDSDSNDDGISTAETDVLRNRKRKRTDASSVSSQPQNKYSPGGSGIHRRVAGSTKSVRSETGSEYKSKKSAGDVKKKGKCDPYAYVPLQRSALNRRKKNKNAQMNGIVKAAGKGAKKGRKAKAKSKK